MDVVRVILARQTASKHEVVTPLSEHRRQPDSLSRALLDDQILGGPGRRP